MKKKLLATILSAAMVMSLLAGCGGTAAEPAATPAAEEAAPAPEAEAPAEAAAE